MTYKKIIKLLEAKHLSIKLKKNKKKIALAHGVFDVLHIGHIKYFEEIKKKLPDSVLFVTITADKFVNKGRGRPMFTQTQRAEMLSQLNIIDYVLIIEDFTAVPSIKNIKPHVYFKGNEYKNLFFDKNLKIEKKELKINSSKIIYINTKKYSSSEIINNRFDNLDKSTKKFLKRINDNYKHSYITTLFENLKKLKVAVIGEAIIDEYIYVKPLNKSPKENLITNLIENGESFLGGSLAVANNIASFSQDVTIFSLLDKSIQNKFLLKKYLNKKIKKKIIFSDKYKTIKKTRFIESSYSTKKLFSLYEMKNMPLDRDVESKIIKLLKTNLKKYDLIIVNDFGHEFFTNKITDVIVKCSRYLSLNVQTNSANMPFNPVTKYKKANFVSIDIPEARIAAGDKYLSKLQMHNKILRKSNFKNLIFTEGKNGSWYFKNNKAFNTPAFNDNVVDTMGAGDAFFSISSLIMKINKDVELACFLGNIAGAIKTSILGHSKFINRQDFFKYVKTLMVK